MLRASHAFFIPYRFVASPAHSSLPSPSPPPGLTPLCKNKMVLFRILMYLRFLPDAAKVRKIPEGTLGKYAQRKGVLQALFNLSVPLRELVDSRATSRDEYWKSDGARIGTLKIDVTSLDEDETTRPESKKSAMKKNEDNNTLVFIVGVKAKKHQIKQAVKKLHDIDVAKVNTLIRPDDEKKAYVHLASDYDALDVANKIGII
ncbi:uncharacterized protein [Ambystoma mexicanum]|uniref:uncharacterized protein n=1 Tax=Ambystoma mexicanum TaxID=8296 RepID=UPI0037E9705B